MQKFVRGLFRLVMPCFGPEGGGPGGGGAAGSGGGQGGGQGGGAAAGTGGGAGAAGAGSGGGSSAAGSGGAGGGAGAPITLSDDTMVLVDGKPMRYADQQRTQRESYEREYGQKFSGNLQNALKKLAANFRQQNPNGGGQPGAARGRGGVNIEELLAKVADQPFVDGQTLKLLADHGMAPLSTAIGSQQKLLEQVVTRLKQLEGGYGSQRERNAQSDFNTMVDSAIGGLGIDAVSAQELVKDPFLRELAQDVYHSYTWDPAKVGKEFPAMLKARYDAAIAHIRAIDKARVGKSKDAALKFPNNAGDGTPGGKGHKKPMTSAELADMIFDQRAAANT